jgi:hypothetical protein
MFRSWLLLLVVEAVFETNDEDVDDGATTNAETVAVNAAADAMASTAHRERNPLARPVVAVCLIAVVNVRARWKNLAENRK